MFKNLCGYMSIILKKDLKITKKNQKRYKKVQNNLKNITKKCMC